MNDIIPDYMMTVMLLILAVMIFMLIRQFEERIKQVKADFYLEGYKDGCKATADKTTEMIREINENYVNKNEVL